MQFPPAQPTDEVVFDRQDAGLTAIPTADIPLTATVIILGSNNLQTIPSKAFSNFTYLKDVNLSYCQLTSVAMDAFLGCPLEQLRIYSNSLASASELFCVEAVRLTLWKLQISDNPMNIVADPDWSVVESFLDGIKDFRANTMGSLGTCPDWSGISDTLTAVRYNGNSVPAFPRDCFLGFRNLKELQINKNLLTSFPDFSMMDGGGESLTSLDLSENVINGIIYDELANLTNLQTLNLAGNRLSTFPDVRNSGIEVLDLSGNPLVCDTRLAWIKQSSSVVVTVEGSPCVEPERLVGVPWNDIGEEDLEPDMGNLESYMGKRKLLTTNQTKKQTKKKG